MPKSPFSAEALAFTLNIGREITHDYYDKY